MIANSYYSTTDNLFDKVWLGDDFEIEHLLEVHKVNLTKTAPVDRTVHVQHAKRFKEALILHPSPPTEFIPLEIAIIAQDNILIEVLLYTYWSPISDNAIKFAELLSMSKLRDELRGGQHLIPILTRFSISRGEHKKYLKSSACSNAARLGVITSREVLENAYNSDQVTKPKTEKEAKFEQIKRSL